MSSFRGACSDFAGSSRNIALKCRLLHYFIRKYHFVVKLLCLCLTQSIKLISTKLQSKATKTFSSEVMKHFTRAREQSMEKTSATHQRAPFSPCCCVVCFFWGGFASFSFDKRKEKVPTSVKTQLEWHTSTGVYSN